MSIIYEALKKTQNARLTKPKQTSTDSPNLPNARALAANLRVTLQKITKWRRQIIYSLFLCTSAAMIFTFFPQIKSSTNSGFAAIAKLTEKPEKKVVINAVDFRAKHILNGIFVSNKETVAFINNKMFHVGDNIDGLRIFTITEEEVRLRNNDSVVVLKMLI